MSHFIFPKQKLSTSVVSKKKNSWYGRKDNRNATTLKRQKWNRLSSLRKVTFSSSFPYPNRRVKIRTVVLNRDYFINVETFLIIKTRLGEVAGIWHNI